MLVNTDMPLADEIDTLGRTRRKNDSPERTVQVTLKRWLERVMPGVVVAAVKNEAAGSGATLRQRQRFTLKRRAEGVRKGFPDLVVDTLDQGVFYIEVKAPGGSISEAQNDLHSTLRAHGRTVIVADAIESLRLGMLQAGLRTIEAKGQPVAKAKVGVVKAKSKLPADSVPF